MGGDPDEQELQKALLMSLQPAPEAKRSKPRDGPVAGTQDVVAQARRTERELRAAAAEQRMLAFQRAQERATPSTSTLPSHLVLGDPLSITDSEKLFTMVFGSSVSKEIITQWCHQGFRFSPDPETSLGLVQREGGPCGVLAPVQAMVLKYLLFENGESQDGPSHSSGSLTSTVHLNTSRDCTLVFSDAQRTRALLSAFAEILWLVGGKTKAVVAVLDTVMLMSGGGGKEDEQDEAMSRKLEGIALNSAMDLQKQLRICTFTSMSSLLHQLPMFLPVFRSHVGALLFLFSALLSRGLESIQLDRDDPGQPLVTAPFGHASQEIVNLLICGHAVPEVFDGNMDVGGGMTVKGIPSKVEVGFLTLLEAFKYCTVGPFLKRPKFPIWVVGSESHYTVLFALQSNIQDENELEDRERCIRQAFDLHDQSGGGGFIVASSMQQLLRDMNITLPRDMLENLCANEFVVWNELCQALHQIEKSKGGLKNSDTAGGSKQFEIYHFNGIAKTVGNSSSSIQQRPRLTKLRVSVPPKWTPEEYMMDIKSSASEKGTDASSSMDTSTEKPKEEPVQHAPIVDCIRTRWERATCNWVGDAPSIV
ncbi:hypothetical protein GOP47_0026584 [Adiantum capillus-veneris]|nr:hypothetical protein GOP47_0026584 [Adiantum capillus-veneris]